MERTINSAFGLLGLVLLLWSLLWQQWHQGGEVGKRDAVSEKIAPKPVPLSKKNINVALSEHEFDLLLAESPWPKEFYPAVKRIAFCESSWIPTAKGPTDDHGLLQVRFKNHAEKVSKAADLYDPLTNLRVAYTLYGDAERGKFKNGFAPWFMSNKCHGFVPSKVAVRIAKFKAKKALKIRIANNP